MRWALRMSEFQFEIKHVPGSKIKHVDALSRHVGLVEETQIMRRNWWWGNRRKNHFVKNKCRTVLQQIVNIFWTWIEFCMREKGKTPKLVVPQSLIQDLIFENHKPIFVAHPGNKRTFELISLKYQLPKMRKNIEYVRRCDKFQTRKGKREFRAPLGEVEDPSEPFQITSMDIKDLTVWPPGKQIFADVYWQFLKVCRRLPNSGRFGRNMWNSFRYTDNS